MAGRLGHTPFGRFRAGAGVGLAVLAEVKFDVDDGFDEDQDDEDAGR